MTNFECLFIDRSNKEPFLLNCSVGNFAEKVASVDEFHLSNVFFDCRIVFHVSPSNKCGYLFQLNLTDVFYLERIQFINDCRLYCFLHGLDFVVRNEWGI